jgi:hypothetical protein
MSVRTAPSGATPSRHWRPDNLAGGDCNPMSRYVPLPGLTLPSNANSKAPDDPRPARQSGTSPPQQPPTIKSKLGACQRHKHRTPINRRDRHLSSRLSRASHPDCRATARPQHRESPYGGPRLEEEKPPSPGGREAIFAAPLTTCPSCRTQYRHRCNSPNLRDWCYRCCRFPS